MLSRIKWESIDGLRPPNGSLKYIPKSEYEALARAILQQGKELPASLKPAEPVPLTRQQQANRHCVVKQGCFDKISKTVYDHGDLLSVRPRPTPLSPFECMPSTLQSRIFDHLDEDVADLVCVGLTSTAMMRSINDLYQAQPWDAEGGLALMDQLSDWMPSHLTLCYHCLTYLPGFSFGPKRSEYSDLVCMDCKFYSREFKGPDNGCVGCDALNFKIEDILEERQEVHGHNTWNELMSCVEEDSTSASDMVSDSELDDDSMDTS